MKTVLAQGIGAEEDTVKAKKLLDKACKGDHRPACHFYGTALYSGLDYVTNSKSEASETSTQKVYLTHILNYYRCCLSSETFF